MEFQQIKEAHLFFMSSGVLSTFSIIEQVRKI